jgi:hypothetical protein
MSVSLLLNYPLLPHASPERETRHRHVFNLTSAGQPAGVGISLRHCSQAQTISAKHRNFD